MEIYSFIDNLQEVDENEKHSVYHWKFAIKYFDAVAFLLFYRKLISLAYKVIFQGTAYLLVIDFI